MTEDTAVPETTVETTGYRFSCGEMWATASAEYVDRNGQWLWRVRFHAGERWYRQRPYEYEVGSAEDATALAMDLFARFPALRADLDEKQKAANEAGKRVDSLLIDHECSMQNVGKPRTEQAAKETADA